MPFRTLTTVLLLFSVSCAASARDSQLNLPSFRHLQGQAIDSVDITIGQWPLKLAASLLDKDDSEDAVAVKELLSGLQSVAIRSYTFDADHRYSRSDIDEVRRQLKGPQWSSLAQLHSKTKDSDVDVYISMEGNHPTGLAIIATEPREFTIVNIVGRIEPKNLGQIGKHFHLSMLAANIDDGQKTNDSAE